MNPFYDAVENEVLAALLAAHVDFVIVGGAAVQWHGVERPRHDLDIFIRPSEKNAVALKAALDTLASARYPFTADDMTKLARPKVQFPLRGPYTGTEFVGHIEGITYDDARSLADLAPSEVGDVPILSRAHLIINKRALGRPEDLADLEALGRVDDEQRNTD
jgi:hypothetical protein